MKKLLSILLMGLILLTASLTFSGEKIYFSDEAGIIAQSDRLKIERALKTMEETYGIPVYAALEYSGASDDTAADRLSHWKFSEMSDELNGILFYVDLTTRQWDFCAFGDGKKIISDDVLDLWEDTIQPQLDKKDYAQAFLKFAEKADYVLALDQAGTPYKAPIPWLFYGVCALGIGLLIAAIVVFSMAAQLKSVHSQAAARNYLKDGSLNVTVSRDIFLYRTVTRTPRPKESSSSSGGRSGGSSGRSGRF